MPLSLRHFRTIMWMFALAAVLVSLDLPTMVNAQRCNVNQPQHCPTAANPNRCISAKSICILEPLPGSTITEITAEDTMNLGAFFRYVNEGGVWKWAFGVGIGAAVTGGVLAGLQIVLSNGDSGKIEAGKNRFLWSTIGLLILLLAGVILQFINPKGFQNI